MSDSMNPQRFSIFLTDLSAWSTNPPPCADPKRLDDSTPIVPDVPQPDAAPRGAITSARRTALATKLKNRLADAKKDEDRDRDITDPVPILDEDDDLFVFDSDPVRY